MTFESAFIVTFVNIVIVLGRTIIIVAVVVVVDGVAITTIITYMITLCTLVRLV